MSAKDAKMEKAKPIFTAINAITTDKNEQIKIIGFVYHQN